MGFPPPPPEGSPPPPDQGGGFGPPQGFGPPPPPPPGNGGYGYPQQGGGQNYGYPQDPTQAAPGPYGQQQGGYGQPGPPGPPVPPGGYGYPQGPGGPGGYPPPPPPNNNKRNLLIGLVVLLVVAGIGTAVALSGGSDDKDQANKPTGKPSISGLPSGLPTDMPSFSTQPIPSFTEPSDDPFDTPTDDPFTDLPTTPTEKVVPYVVLSPGKCFDAPTLTPTVDTVTTKSCSSAHDGQVVANETLSGTFTDDSDIQSKALELCTADAKKHLPADGRLYYPYALFPKLTTYELQGRKTVTCSLTLNNGTNSKKLYAPLG